MITGCRSPFSAGAGGKARTRPRWFSGKSHFPLYFRHFTWFTSKLRYPRRHVSRIGRCRSEMTPSPPPSPRGRGGLHEHIPAFALSPLPSG
jgi:hypothetical protein